MSEIVIAFLVAFSLLNIAMLVLLLKRISIAEKAATLAISGVTVILTQMGNGADITVDDGETLSKLN